MSCAYTRRSLKAEAMLQWLCQVDFNDSHCEALRACHQGTCSWFLESDDFKQWKARDSSFLWISGIGKS